MAFRFISMEGLAEPPTTYATKGSLVHRALELLFVNPRPQRTHAAAHVAFERAVAEYRDDPELVLLHLDAEHDEAFMLDAWSLVESYLRMEDPTVVRDIGLELRLETQVGGVGLRGIIDRLELDEDGGLVVTDYKTGRPPSLNYEQRSLSGVHFYSFLCDAVLGRRPTAIRLMYLRDGLVITARPSAQSVRFMSTRATAVWRAIEHACATDGFEPRPSSWCASCAFQAWCPAFGGDPARAVQEFPADLAVAVERVPA